MSYSNVITNQDHVANRNPIRYRGYYYDTESGLYYLNSRYYDPVTGRFVNADGYISGFGGDARGYNLFAYCFNNPVNMSDPIGNWPSWSQIFTGIAIAAVAVAAVAAVVATAGAAAPALAVAGGGIIGGISVGAAATAATVATGAMIVAGASTVAAVTSAVAEKSRQKKMQGNHTVYRLTDPNDGGKTKYVGRTVNAAARKNVHANDPSKAGLVFEPIKTGLNYYQARGLEQIAMLEYNTKSYLNKINGISPNNRNLGIYMAAGRQFAHYIGNQISNEILYWTGN